MGTCFNSLVGGGGILGGIGHLLLNLLFFGGAVAVLGLGAVWLTTQFGYRKSPSAPVVDPLEIARRRLAEGKITLAEFEEIRGQLQG